MATAATAPSISKARNPKPSSTSSPPQEHDTKFDPTKALFADWTSADILFQLTDEELSAASGLFKDTTVKPSLLQSYLFFAIELKGKDDPRGAPVLSIAVINRRRNKLHA